MATPAPVAVPGEAAAPTGSGPTASPPPTSSNILFASTNGVAEGGEGTRGLLVSLLTLFDINHSKNLSRHEYAQAAGPLGFDTSEDAWLQLCGRFGDKSSKKQLEKHQDGRPVTGGEVDTTLDLTLLGEYFSNKYDPLLEELLRRLLRGVINVSARSAMLERRLRVVEDHLEATSMRELREREHKISRVVRRWRNRYTSMTFDAWKALVDSKNHILQRTARHWINQLTSMTWRRWRDMVHEAKAQREAAHRAIGRWRNRFLHETFRDWAAFARESVEYRASVMERALTTWTNLAVVNAFELWRVDVEHTHRIQRLQRRILLRMQGGLVFECFYAWCNLSGDESDRRTQLITRAAMRLSQTALVQTFEAWAEATTMGAVGRSHREMAALQFAARLCQPIVVHTFDEWVEQTAHRRAVRLRATYAIGDGRLLGMCMRAWAVAARQSVRARERDWVQGLVGETVPQMISASIEASLRERVESRVSEQAAVSTHLADTLSQLQSQMTALQEQLVSTKQRHLRDRDHMLNRIIRGLRGGCLSGALSLWTEYVRQSHRLHRRALEYWRVLPLRQAVRAWAEQATYTSHLERVATQIRAGSATYLTATVLRGWRQLVRYLGARRSAGLVRALGAWRQRTLIAFFYPWRAFAERSVTVGLMRRNAIHKMLHGLLAAAFTSLACYAYERHERRQALLADAAHRLYHRSLLLAWRAWHDIATERAATRQRLYTTAIHRFKYGRLAATFEAWQRCLEQTRKTLRRAAYYFGDGFVMTYCFGRWRAVYERAVKVRKTEWLLSDLRLVGVGWLVETLDQIFPVSLPERSQLYTAVATAVGQPSPTTSAASPTTSPGNSPPLLRAPIGGAEALTYVTTAPAEADAPPPAWLHLPQPPPQPRERAGFNRGGGGGGGGGGDAGTSQLPLPSSPPLPLTGVGAHAAPSARASSSPSPSGLGGAGEQSPLSPGMIRLPADADAIGSTDAHGGEIHDAPGGGDAPRSLSPWGVEAGSTALHALGAFLDRQSAQSQAAVRETREQAEGLAAAARAETARLEREVRELQAMQLEHARISYADATKRTSDAASVDSRLSLLHERLAEVDEQCSFLKDTLYSLVASSTGLAGPPKAPPSKKFLKPVKASGRHAAASVPWNAAVLP